MSKIVVALSCALPLILAGCGGGSSAAPLLTSPADPETSTGSSSSSSSSPTSQTITFDQASLAMGSTVTLQATASSGLPVVYTSQTPSTCTVSGNNVTASALGSCTLTANQAGNSSYTAAPQVQIIVAVLNAQSITGFVAPALSASGLAVMNPSSTSSLPVQITSLTPAVCGINQNIAIKAAATTGTCTLYASQAGDDLYAAAPPLTISTVVTASTSMLAPNAQLAPWITTPQAGSTTADSTTSLEGIYSGITSTGDTSGAFAFIDGTNNFDYYDFDGLLLGSLTQATNTWFLNSSAAYYPASSTAITANGAFAEKKTFTATAQSFTTITPLINLIYSPDNGFAATQASVAGNWLYNDATEQFNLSISSTGEITGTEFDNSGGQCNLIGSIVQTESASQHNMYAITLSASNISGSFCNLDVSGPYAGLAALSFASAGASDSNGYLPTLGILAQDAATKSPLKLVLLNP